MAIQAKRKDAKDTEDTSPLRLYDNTHLHSIKTKTMKLTRYALTLLLAVMACTASMAQNKKPPTCRTAIPRDSIRLSDPCILADDETRTYYMTGTGGLLWKSKDLDRWDGPYIVAETDPDSWMGHKPQIWAT